MSVGLGGVGECLLFSRRRSAYDLSRHFVSQHTLLPTPPEFAAVDVVLPELPRFRNPLPPHIRCGASPRGVEPAPIRS